MALPDSIARPLAAALDTERRRVEADETAAANAGSWWTSAIGADSTVTALRASAHAGRVLYEAHAAKAARLSAAGDVQAAADLVHDIERENGQPSTVLDAAAFLSVKGAATDIGAGMARDVGKGAAALADASLAGAKGLLALIRWLPLLAVAAVAVYVWRRSRSSSSEGSL